MPKTDIIVIGAGIAGASAAAELATNATVTLLEMEAQPGYHATGRSAAYFAAAYGKKVVRDFTGCCEGFFRQPPDDFNNVELLRPRDCMFFARADQAEQLRFLQQDNPALVSVSASEVLERVPVFAESYVHAGLWEPRGGDLDVDAILQGYLRRFRRRGGTLETLFAFVDNGDVLSAQLAEADRFEVVGEFAEVLEDHRLRDDLRGPGRHQCRRGLGGPGGCPGRLAGPEHSAATAYGVDGRGACRDGRQRLAQHDRCG